MYTLVWDKHGFDVRQEKMGLAATDEQTELSGMKRPGQCSVSYAEWSQFMRTGQCDVKCVNRALQDSWTRCRRQEVDPGPRKCWNFLPMENLEPAASYNFV